MNADTGQTFKTKTPIFLFVSCICFFYGVKWVYKIAHAYINKSQMAGDVRISQYQRNTWIEINDLFSSLFFGCHSAWRSILSWRQRQSFCLQFEKIKRKISTFFSLFFLINVSGAWWKISKSLPFCIAKNLSYQR